MNKYEFKTISLDEFELHYTKNGEAKIIPFKRTVEVAKKMQSINATARFNMFSYLNSMGKSKKDLCTETVVDGKTIIDESNYKEFERAYMLEECFKLANAIYGEILGMDLIKVVEELELTNDQAAMIFSTKLRMIIAGEENSPS